MTFPATTDPELPAASPPPEDRAGWLERIATLGEEAGYFEPLGGRHWAFFRDDSPTLLVTFETVEEIRATGPEQQPYGDSLARSHGWSHLCLIADGQTWYRDPAVYRYIDRLVDDAFFEDFDRVIFYGAGMGGYAACAYSLAAPGATVLAVQPRATLDPAVAGWDRRHLAERRLDFTDRYGFAPDMVEGTGEVFLLHDPAEIEDAMHAALFCRPNVTQLRCRHAGSALAQSLAQMQILPQLIAAAGQGELTAGNFARLWRARRNHKPYILHLLALNEARPTRALGICRSVNARLRLRRIRARQDELEAAQRRKG